MGLVGQWFCHCGVTVSNTGVQNQMTDYLSLPRAATYDLPAQRSEFRTEYFCLQKYVKSPHCWYL